MKTIQTLPKLLTALLLCSCTADGGHQPVEVDWDKDWEGDDPGCAWLSRAQVLAMVPLGTKRAASMPVLAAASSSRALTVGSSP